MFRTMIVATGVVLVAVVAYLALLGGDAGPRDADQAGVPPPADSAAVGAANQSNRAAADVATDSATQSARAGEDPVQGSLETSRAAADAAGAVGGAAFTAEGYDRQTVLSAIESADLAEARKDELRDILAAADPDSEAEMQAALTEIREALTEG